MSALVIDNISFCDYEMNKVVEVSFRPEIEELLDGNSVRFYASCIIERDMDSLVDVKYLCNSFQVTVSEFRLLDMIEEINALEDAIVRMEEANEDYSAEFSELLEMIENKRSNVAIFHKIEAELPDEIKKQMSEIVCGIAKTYGLYGKRIKLNI